MLETVYRDSTTGEMARPAGPGPSGGEPKATMNRNVSRVSSVAICAQVTDTNLAFREWHTIVPNTSCAVGFIDRLTHHAAIVKITGGSCRLREAVRTQKARLVGLDFSPESRGRQ